MAKIIMFLVESIVISSMVYLLYWSLFKGKASYFAQRVLLLSIPIIATISAFVSYEFIELEGFGGEIIDDIVMNDTMNETQPVTTEVISTEGFKIIRSNSRNIGADDLAMSLWGLVTLILFALFVWRLAKIITLRRVAERENYSDYSIYRVSADNVVFSFWRGVYLSKTLTGTKYDFIMRHELEHIRRYHYIDKFIAELYATLFWFNPIVRVIQRELALIHEFEADHAVVRSGCNVRDYKMFIFEEATSYVPTFANGINSSHIKKRFITMDKRHTVTHRVLRALMSIITIVVIASISMVYVEAKETPRNILDEIPPEDIKSISVDSDTNLIKITKKDGTVVSYNQEQAQKANISSPNTKRVAPSVDAKREQIYVTDYNRFNRDIYVVRCEDHTKVFIGMRVAWNRHWCVLSEESYLVDQKTGDQYVLHSSASGLPIQEVIWVVNEKDNFVYFELIFPPLDKDVKRVDFKENVKSATTEGYTNRRYLTDQSVWHYRNVKVEKKLPYFVSDEYQKQQDKEPRIIKLDENFELK